MKFAKILTPASLIIFFPKTIKGFWEFWQNLTENSEGVKWKKNWKMNTLRWKLLKFTEEIMKAATIQGY
jgi:hypothetical protein